MGNEILVGLLHVWFYFSLVYLLLVNSSYLILAIVSFFAIRNHLHRTAIVDDKFLFRYAAMLKPVSILAPAYNEELGVVENIRSLLHLNYVEYEVILINDGSTDGTLNTLVEAYTLEPVEYAASQELATKPVRGVFRSKHHENLLVIDKENGGKADALNAGINYCRYSLFLAIDTDSLLERDVLLKMIRPFLEMPETIAVGGIVRAINGCKVRDGEVVQVDLPGKILPTFQVVEYLRAFLYGRVGWAALDMLIVISGAFGMFHRQTVVEAGGYRETVGEDLELIVRLHRRMRESGRVYRIAFSPEPVCWTEVPETLSVLGRQRNRWSRGLMDTIRMHKKMLFNPAYGRVGLIALPYALIVEGFGAVIEIFSLLSVLGFWALGLLDNTFAIAFLSVSMLYGVVISLSAFVLEELNFRRYPKLTYMLVLLAYGVLENFGYHQLSLWWRLMGIVDFYRGKKSWGVITRKGFAQKEAPPYDD